MSTWKTTLTFVYQSISSFYSTSQKESLKIRILLHLKWALQHTQIRVWGNKNATDASFRTNWKARWQGCKLERHQSMIRKAMSLSCVEGNPSLFDPQNPNGDIDQTSDIRRNFIIGEKFTSNKRELLWFEVISSNWENKDNQT